tara:strand:- start:5844 stop:6212 length:369 start_codon:yes stop_codon:yes gene_type:complete
MTTVLRGSDNFDTGRFTSSAQTITAAGLLTLAHGLGRKPFGVSIYLECVTASEGYSIGDELETSFNATASGLSRFNSAYTDETNVYIRYSDASGVFAIGNKATGTAVALTPANWRLRVRAWA